MRIPSYENSLKIGLALGGGGARGIAHIHVLEALDDLGLKPAAMTGTSIGAIIGAASAAGLGGYEIRDILISSFRNQAALWAKLWQLRPRKWADIIGSGRAQLDPERVLELFLPAAVPDDFDALAIPLAVIATDFYHCREVDLRSGPLRRAIAASIALPILFKPVEIQGKILIDGGAVNPLPFDHLPDDLDLTIAVDVVGAPVQSGDRSSPRALESIFGASQILMQSLMAEKLKTRQPDILVKPAVNGIGVLDFYKAATILKATEKVKDEVKRQIEAALHRPLAELTQRRLAKKSRSSLAASVAAIPE